MTSFTPTFTPVPVPELTRSRSTTEELNPFVEAVRGLVPDSGAALAFTVPGTAERIPSASGKTSKYANRDLRKKLQLLDLAALECDVTARRKIQDDGDVTTVTFWTIPRIIRGRSEQVAEDTDDVVD